MLSSTTTTYTSCAKYAGSRSKYQLDKNTRTALLSPEEQVIASKNIMAKKINLQKIQEDHEKLWIYYKIKKTNKRNQRRCSRMEEDDHWVLLGTVGAYFCY